METVFRISEEVRIRFPEIEAAYGVIRGLAVRESVGEMDEEKEAILGALRTKLDPKTLNEHPRISGFRRIYKRFGVDPGSRRPSAEALLRRVLDLSKDLYRVNNVVDAYNLSSIEFMLPIAAYDLQFVSLPIELRFAIAGDVHTAIGDNQAKALVPGELVYSDSTNILCKDFNYRDSDITKVNSTTRDIIVFVDGCEGVSRNDLLVALESTLDRITRYCGGKAESVATSHFPLG